ncbi:G-protein coupled receptor 182 [Tupaia chinensis]|uniref:G-protein coupled receptor 182 n=1 Tax=Tupaia chinensis TaxID=246437 RepID=L8Y2S7_TUPCH|nr:G-protein coupled receptor 182 [Tupaia chinensis]
MMVQPSLGPSPSEGFTTVPAHDFGEIHNWTDLLSFFNHTLSECHVELSESTKRVVLFVLYLAIFVVGLVENLLVVCVNWRCPSRAGALNLHPCRLRRLRLPDGRRHCLLVCVYVAVFLICWLPYHVILLLLTLHGTHISLHCYLVHLLYFFYDVIDCFSMLHCVVNPLLYNFLSPGFQSRLLSAVVHYLPKDHARAGTGRSSSSSTQHSIVITKEGSQPSAAGPHPHQSLNLQAPSLPPNTSPTSTPQSLVSS